MIKASKVLIDYIEAQVSPENLAEELNVSRQTIHNIKSGENVSSEMVAKFLKITGFEFEKAFEVKA